MQRFHEGPPCQECGENVYYTASGKCYRCVRKAAGRTASEKVNSKAHREFRDIIPRVPKSEKKAMQGVWYG